MVVSTQQITTYSASIYNASPTLLPENIASFITAIALATRLSIRCSSLLIEALLESVKYSTSFSFGLSRQALIKALSTAKKLHELTAPSTSTAMIRLGQSPTANADTLDPERSGFLQVLDKYTNLGIYIVHHSFTLVELFALSGIHFTSQTIKSGLMAAEESVSIIDGIFGSNESSRAIASIITLVHRELMTDPDFALTKIGKVAILSGLTKALTAFAVLQNVTHKRTMNQMKITVLWKGLVVEEEKNTQALIQFQSNNDGEVNDDESSPEHTDIIHELEEILASTSTSANNTANGDTTSLISLSSSSSDLNGKSIDLALDDFGNPYNLYEITTTTNRIITRTTRIRPIDIYGEEQLSAKQIVEKTNEEEKESFMAVIDHHEQYSQGEESYTTDDSGIIPTDTSKISFNDGEQDDSKNNQQSTAISLDYNSKSRPPKSKSLGFKIMLSSVSKKLSRKKIERQTKYGIITNNHQNDTIQETIDGPVTTVTSTSTTLQSSYSSHKSNNHHSTTNNKPLPSISHTGDSQTNEEESETKSKRRMSWSGLKIKNLAKKKSVSNLFQRGADALTQQMNRPPPPPIPSPYLQKSNSINSLASLSRTLKTTTFHTTQPSSPPARSTSRSLIRSPSVPAKLHQKQIVKSPLNSEPNPRNFPKRHIITNIAHFIRYASAAYGENFMRILGIGDIPSVLPNSHHPNHHAFAHHTGVSIQDILLSSYTDNNILSSMSHSKLHALVHYVTVDHSAEAIVLTCRGTLGLGDVLTDLTCDYKEFTLPTDQLPHAHNPTNKKNEPRHYVAHGGMLEAAQLLATQKGKVFETIKKGLDDYPSYGLVVCGHSLGAGVASLLSVLWSEERIHYIARRMEDDDKPEKFLNSFAASSIRRESCPFVTSELSGLPSGRPIHCYTYGSPCVMSLPLSEYCGQGLVTSVVHAFDIVSSLSLGLLKDFKNVAVSLHEDNHITDQILSRVIGRYHKNASEPTEEEEHDQWFWALIKTMRADMKAEKLFPPSTMYLIESIPQLAQHSKEESEEQQGRSAITKNKRAHMVQFSRCDDVQARFSEIVFSRTMFMDHSPNMYEKAIKQLNKGYFGNY